MQAHHSINPKHSRPISERLQFHTGLSLPHGVCYDASTFVPFRSCIKLLTF
jgi:hypothetical protein